MTNLTEFTFLSSDGKTQLHAMQWLPEGTPRAVLQISHGVAEHIGRYDALPAISMSRGSPWWATTIWPRRLSAGGRNPRLLWRRHPVGDGGGGHPAAP